jgi:NAD(P)H-hydrate epimerase
VHVASIAIPDEAVAAQRVALELSDPAVLAAALPHRRPDSHKGDFGHVLVVAGSRGTGGAARMTCLAALRAGCGLVPAAIPASVQGRLVGGAMEAMTEGMPETREGTLAYSSLPRLIRLLQGKRAVALGPGLTTHPETKKLVRAVIRRVGVPLVLDADGLNAFAGHTDLLSGARRPLLLTPHPGEMARLTSRTTAAVQADRVTTARDFARRHRCLLILKGHQTLIASPDGGVCVNPTGNPGMATGGAGDILTGLLAGLLAQGIPAGVAARLGTYLHGLAGDLAAARVGEMPLLARDILNKYPAALRRLRESGEGAREATA